MGLSSSSNLAVVLSALGVGTAASAKNVGDITFTYISAEELVKDYLQDPNGLVQFRNIRSSNHTCFALFDNGHTAGATAQGNYLLPDSGVILSSGNPEDLNGNDSNEATTDFHLEMGDADLRSQLPPIESAKVFDPCFIEFEFQCPPETAIFTPSVNFDYVFGSEEYYEYVFSDYNDGFGFFLNGENIALLPDGTTPVTINTVNFELNSEYFIGNELVGRASLTSPYPKLEADGITTELTAVAEPRPGWNNIKLVIGDVADGILDSWVLLEKGTFSCIEKTAAPSLSMQPSTSPTTKPTTKPTFAPSKSPTAMPTPIPTQNPTSKPTSEPTRSPSVSPTSSPTKSPSAFPTSTPTAAPSGSPTEKPTAKPSSKPTEEPTVSPSLDPTSSPTMNPTLKPTFKPTAKPTFKPSATPTSSPTESPSASPISKPSASPSDSPSVKPMAKPSGKPTKEPTTSPSLDPTSSPTLMPISKPTFNPSAQPTTAPSSSPTGIPTGSPNDTPTLSPSFKPTNKPTDKPTLNPTSSPSGSPTGSPFRAPTSSPTEKPTRKPTGKPSSPPTFEPSRSPTGSPIATPTLSPTELPTYSPTFELATVLETDPPSRNPTRKPTPCPDSTENQGNITFTYISAEELVKDYLLCPDDNIQFQNIRSSNHRCFALFENGHSAGATADGNFLLPDSGVVLSSGNPEDLNGNDSDHTTTDFNLTMEDLDLKSQLPPKDSAKVFDPCFIEFEFQCPPETEIFTPFVNFDYVFGSEEYHEYVFSDYNDGFGFFLNGENIALLPDGTTPVTINTVNYEHNPEYFIGNELVGRNTFTSPYPKLEADGITTELTALAEPQPGWNKIKLVIGDVADGVLDSWVLLEKESFSCIKKTESPSNKPTQKPGSKPTTESPTVPEVVLLPVSSEPTASPNVISLVKPSSKPTDEPTVAFTNEPTSSPSLMPTSKPTTKPTKVPTAFPTQEPTSLPSHKPTFTPTTKPTEEPTINPTEKPSSSPTWSPTYRPTHKPTETPTKAPSSSPTESPTQSPSLMPTSTPSLSSQPSWPYPCGILPCDRASDLRELYSTISDPVLFENPASPQSLALDWIINHDSMAVCPNDPNTCHTIQRYVLAVFYFSTQGYQWSSCSAPKDYMCEEEISKANEKCNRTVTAHFANDRVGINESNAWLTPGHECDWGGLACHGENEPEIAFCLDQIDFEANGIAGVIPDEIAQLETLRYLYLEKGDLSGSIPSAIGELKNLKVIDLDFNSLTGTIPESLYDLSSLRQLDLNNNQLTGTLSSRVGLLSNLSVIQVDNNNLSGTIPSELGQLKQLAVGFFSYNNFTGLVDEGICELREPEGNLGMLQVDCVGENPEVVCQCCSSCRQPEETGESLRKLVEN